MYMMVVYASTILIMSLFILYLLSILFLFELNTGDEKGHISIVLSTMVTGCDCLIAYVLGSCSGVIDTV